jgi:hypothetical protein
MSLLLHGDCLEHMKDLDDDSIDLIFCDLPYGQTSCKWDCKIDLDKFWIEVMRIKKLHTPIFFTTTTKFGVELINSAPKKCFFRYDIVWVKSAPVGFLSAKKMPMRKHEMVYVFYEKLPYYDLSSHKHKFIKEVPTKRSGKDGVDNVGMIKNRSKSGMERINKYDPPLPTSIVKEDFEIVKRTDKGCNGLYGSETNKVMIKDKNGKNRNNEPRYDPPLPTTIVKEEKTQISKPHDKDLYGDMKGGTIGNVHGTNYDPPLPTTIVKEEHYDDTIYGDIDMVDFEGRNGSSRYEPPLPTTMLEIKSTKGKHSTEKPVALMEWILKYYSKEGDTILDPTMGSGSTGVACKNMKRNFIGIEMDDDIFDVAYKRINE